MSTNTKRVRKTKAGFVGVLLVKGGDMTLFNRLEKELESDPELDRSKVVRLALKEYFDRKDAGVDWHGVRKDSDGEKNL